MRAFVDTCTQHTNNHRGCFKSPLRYLGPRDLNRVFYYQQTFDKGYVFLQKKFVAQPNTLIDSK